jgi:hypothetical protein
MHCTSTRSRPELTQFETVMRCTPSLCTPRNCSSSFCCWTRDRFGLAVSHLHMSEPRASLTRSPFAGSASLLPRLAFRRTPWLRPRCGYRVLASRATAFRRYSSCACRCSARRTPASPARAHGPALFRPPNTCTHRQLSRVIARTLASSVRRRSGSLLHRPRTAPVPLGSRATHASASRLPREQHPHPCLRAPVRAHLRPCACCSCSGRAIHARTANRVSSALRVCEPSCLR